MFSWFKKREEPAPLVFDDAVAAFDYACRHLENRILLEAILPALVEERGRRGEEGEQWFRLRIASPEGGRELWGCTLKEATAQPSSGDLVGFRIVKIAADLPEPMNIIGFISCKLQPVLVGKKGWRIAENYTPPNLKPEIRL